jgi:hypothetical protein
MNFDRQYIFGVKKVELIHYYWGGNGFEKIIAIDTIELYNMTSNFESSK